MSYTTRILPAEEWPRLNGTEAETVWPLFDPRRTDVVVVERDGAIVGTWTLLDIPHVECCWIDPAYRTRGTVAGRLLSAMQRTARAKGIRRVMTAALDDRARQLIEHLGGTPLPGDHFSIPISEVSTCQPL